MAQDDGATGAGADRPSPVTALPRVTALPAVPDPAFERFARLVRDVLDVPTALVAVVAADGQVLPGALGLPEPWQSTRSTSLSHSFCQDVVASGRPLVLTDARTDPQRAGSLAVRELGMVAYAGVPLVDAAGTALGSLCAVDHRPRAWTARELGLLDDLAGACSSELQLRLERTAVEADRSRVTLADRAGAVGTFDWDLTGTAMAWDSPLLEMFGYTEADFEPTTASFYRRLHPEDADRVTQAITTAIGTGGEFHAEYRIVLPGGDTRWVQGRGQVLTDTTGTPVRFIGAAYDTTDVHDGDVRVGRLLTAMPSGFVSLDRDWRFTLLNPAAEALLGRSQAELLGRTIWEAFPDTAGSEFERGYRAAVATQQPQTVHAHYPPPLDAWYDVLCWPSPDGLSLFFTDVTDRARSDAQAAASTARLALLASIADALGGGTELPDVLAGLPRLLVPAVADACVLTVLGPDGRARDLGYWHADPGARAHLAGYVSSRAVELSAGTPLAQVLHDGRTRHLAPGRTAPLARTAQARQHLDALGPVRATLVPLSAQSGTTGVLTLLSAADRPQDREMEAITADVADRSARPSRPTG
ncbi:PAS domain-containing protein [Klenkia taihuensis]|uniref:PAS domain-containing protein n=1 Tax=Klenkia taihuensis TaxID=1225127 RepID=UPI000B88348A|nr:PAS domain-containing protein [Klenkia taihuensis]GHE07154.1 hypothetical protein GCM10011381_02110 [Klenkia taihuensis]